MNKIITIPTGQQIGDMVSLMRLPEANLDQLIARYSSTFITNSQDIAQALEDAPLAAEDKAEVTGIMSYEHDGEIIELWTCTDSAHYMNTSTYTRII